MLVRSYGACAHAHTCTCTLCIIFTPCTCTCIICCREYATDVNVLVARKAIQAIGNIALRVAARANTCADKLVSLLAMEIDYVTAETLVSLASE